MKKIFSYLLLLSLVSCSESSFKGATKKRGLKNTANSTSDNGKDGTSDNNDDIAKNADTQAFVQSFGKGVFGDYCAACHQTGGVGVIGSYPNLSDDSWLWGGTTADIENTIRHGHLGFMPSFKGTLSEEQIDETANYVLSLSGEEADSALAAKGEEIFQGQTGGCYLCHTEQGSGMKEQGSANLTDQIWTIADVKHAGSKEAKLNAVKSVIKNGVQRTMPAWSSRLDDTQIKVLTAYINSFGGGQ